MVSRVSYGKGQGIPGPMAYWESGGVVAVGKGQVILSQKESVLVSQICMDALREGALVFSTAEVSQLWRLLVRIDKLNHDSASRGLFDLPPSICKVLYRTFAPEPVSPKPKPQAVAVKQKATKKSVPKPKPSKPRTDFPLDPTLADAHSRV